MTPTLVFSHTVLYIHMSVCMYVCSYDEHCNTLPLGGVVI